MLLPRLDGSTIGGIVVGSALIVVVVLAFLWYRRRHRPPGDILRGVLGGLFSSDGENGEVGFSTHLTRLLRNAPTRSLTSSVVPFPPSAGGSDLPEGSHSSNEKLRLRTWEPDHQPEAGVVPQEVATVVPDVVTSGEDTRNERMQDFGLINYASENEEGAPGLPPDYQQATEPLIRIGDVG